MKTNKKINKHKIVLDFSTYILTEDDISHLERDFCDYPCSTSGEIWFEWENDYRIMYICKKCMDSLPHQ